MKKKWIIEIEYSNLENEPIGNAEEILKPFMNLGVNVKSISLKTE